MESMAVALEPMKDVGELAPAIDELVSVLESQAVGTGAGEATPRLSADELLTNLADQLANGSIDPWTFRSALMAMYPAEDSTELLRRLVDLLGSQRLPGDLFRAVYDAVQVAQPPQGGGSSSSGQGGSTGSNRRGAGRNSSYPAGGIEAGKRRI